MSAFVVAGLVLGGIYAISTVGLALTYTASRIFNFGHGAIAFWVASCYYQFNTRMGWSIAAAAVVSIFVIGPATGLFLWAVLFRRITNASPAVKLVSTIGLFVAIPPLTLFIFDDKPVFKAPGLAGEYPTVHEVLGVAINTDQLVVLGAAALMAILLAAMLRYTTFGLQIRAVVDSPTMSELVGTNTSLVSASTWAIGSFLAGLAGVLVAPIIGLGPQQFAVLVISSFAALVVARLRSLPGAFAGAMLLGLAQSISVKYLPSEGLFSRGIRPSIPFVVMGIFLFLYRNQQRERTAPDTDLLEDEEELAAETGYGRFVLPALAITVLLALPLLFRDFWIGIIAGGVALGVIFLSYTVVTGEGGMISLCQISFAGVGALMSAQFMSEWGWPTLPAVLVSGLIAVPFGLLIALPALRLGDLYLALATLAFALLMDNIVFQMDRFANFGLGVSVDRPVLFGIDFDEEISFFYAMLAIFLLFALVVRNLRHSTTGMTLAAVRSSEQASSTLGISIVRAKLTSFAISAFIAGVGGGCLAIYQRLADPPAFAALEGVIWLAVVVTWGIRSSFGALAAGILLPVMTHLMAQHLDPSYANLTAAAFGLGAIGLAREPRGVLVMNRFAIRKLRRKVSGVRSSVAVVGAEA